MSADANRKTAEDLFARLSTGDIPGALELLTDDVAWTIAGRREDLPTAGTYDKKRIEKLMNVMQSQMTSPMVFTITGRVAEGNKIALEAEGAGHLTNGKTYSQHFHFLLEFSGGKICAVREYLDTQHAYSIWYRN